MRTLLIGLFFFFASYQVESNSNVVLQLKWQHQFQFAGYYMAIERGYYHEQGLNVTIVPATPQDVDTIPKVLSGQADFGIANSGLLLHRMEGESLVAMSAIFQSSPYCWLARTDQGIKTVTDFKGKRIAFFNRKEGAELFAMLSQHGLGTDDFILENSKVSLQNWINGDVDILQVYATNEPFLLKQRQIDFHLFCPKKHGLNAYSDVLFTRQDVIDKDPQLVQSFHTATNKGWREAINHPEEAIEVIKTYYNSQKSRAHLAFEAQKLINFVHSDHSQLGQMSSSRWRVIADMYGIDKQVVDQNLPGFMYQTVKSQPWNISWMHILACVIIVVSFPSYYRLLSSDEKRKNKLLVKLN